MINGFKYVEIIALNLYGFIFNLFLSAFSTFWARFHVFRIHIERKLECVKLTGNRTVGIEKVFSSTTATANNKIKKKKIF